MLESTQKRTISLVNPRLKWKYRVKNDSEKVNLGDKLGGNISRKIKLEMFSAIILCCMVIKYKVMKEKVEEGDIYFFNGELIDLNAF